MNGDNKLAMVVIVAVIVAAVVVAIAGMIIGTKAINNVGEINIDYKEAFLAEREIADASLGLLHCFYGDSTNLFWKEEVMILPEYERLDKAMRGDWEDFYYYSSPCVLDEYLINK